VSYTRALLFRLKHTVFTSDSPRRIGLTLGVDDQGDQPAYVVYGSARKQQLAIMQLILTPNRVFIACLRHLVAIIFALRGFLTLEALLRAFDFQRKKSYTRHMSDLYDCMRYMRLTARAEWALNMKLSFCCH